MARRERQLHMQMYPGWNARDNYGMMKKKKRKKEKTGDGGRGNYLCCSFPGLKQGRPRPAPTPGRRPATTGSNTASHLPCPPCSTPANAAGRIAAGGSGRLWPCCCGCWCRAGVRAGQQPHPAGLPKPRFPLSGTTGTNLHLTFPAVACAKPRRTGQVL